MIASFSTLLLSAATLTAALPALEVRTVTALNTAAFEEAQQRDATATRAFSSTTIKTSDGKCLLVNELSGDFRANFTPIQVADCDGSTGQAWDIITAGKHDDQVGTMLVVNTLTQACMNFDPRRAAGNTVIMFSCGGRADGGGAVTNSQLFNFTGGSGPLSLAPLNAVGTCLAVTSANVLDQAPCSSSDSTQSFTFGGSSAPVSALASTSESDVATSTSAEAGASETAVTASTTADAAAASSTDCNSTTMITVTRGAASASSASTPTSSSESAATTSAAEVGNIPDFSPTSAVPVSRAGGVLQPSAVAESNARDDTAVRAFSSVSIKSSTGQCLFIDPTAGDFRENLIPISVVDCTGSANEQFDLITSGAHNNAENSTLIVSSLTQGCVNFDARRVTGDTVIMFSCGGRADGSGETTNSQLFPFSGNGITNIVLAPENDNGATCLVVNGAKLDSAPCSGDASQVFTIG